MTTPVFLSILIPVYNWDISELLTRLTVQVEELGDQEGVEIIAMEDGSTEKFSNKVTAEKLSQVRYHEFSANQGRAVIRNLLLQAATGEFVLFLDADMLPDRDNFLQGYLDEAKDGKDIICGGISYLQCDREDPRYSFYLYKSARTEALPAAVRQETPWRYLFTSNILLPRETMESVSFSMTFSGYGFEDIEWGIRLGRSHGLKHIDNPCSHMGLMEKSEVFAKMRESIPNFGLLLSLHPACGAQTGAGAIATRLKKFPGFFLRFCDRSLSSLFHKSQMNKLLFICFQLDKAVLLALYLRKNDDKEQDREDA